LLYFATAGTFLFGYAKPVPVRFGNLRHPKKDMIWVALAGPGSNLIQAIFWAIIYLLLVKASLTEHFFLEMCQAGVLVNVVMFAFNLFPLPPLDGGRILVGVLPWKQAAMVSRIEPWGFFIVLGLVVTGVISTLWMRPVMSVTYWLLDTLLVPLRFIF
jgi:Zn-dependent protease